MKIQHVDLIDKDLLYHHVKALSVYERLTGEDEAESAVDYIVENLQQHHIPYERYQFDGYFSDPIYGEVSIIAPMKLVIRAKARSFGANLPQGVKGHVLYDFYSEQSSETSGPVDRYEKMKDKIIISWNYYEDYVKKLEKAGAIGLIHIWPSKEKALHEETVGTIWGTPTIENVGQLTKIPVVGINHEDGVKLLEWLNEERSLEVLLKTEVRNSVKKTSLPVATIRGEIEEYILVSGHYDSWYKGATDNATANALMLELARIFSTQECKRSIKIAWWPGHSNGRYAGSAWYCDQFFEEINEKCVAHINIDFPGTKGNVQVVPRSTAVEKAELLTDIIRDYTNREPSRMDYLPRGADQSFWGTNIPIHLMLKYEPLDQEKIYQTPGGNWWWHTEEDLLDKVDSDLLVRDTGMHVELVDHLANATILPVNLIHFLTKSKGIMKELDENSDEAFRFTTIYQAFEKVTKMVEELLEKETTDVASYNKLLKTVGGTFNRLKFSYSSKYDYDNTYPFHPYPGLAKVKGVYQSNTSQEEFLFNRTFFVRQRNRLVNEINEVSKEIERYLE
ncbi:M28 family peptidase [Niallia sp.]|uniref:M28 family peptidase n=1 Tax=Niallia sp. TaxID=2837523 RepID=UPI002898F7A3|nr:M28 family peptidase [Niallia sp.]